MSPPKTSEPTSTITPATSPDEHRAAVKNLRSSGHPRSQVGVVLLLLVLGLEYTAEELVTNLRRQAPVGALDLLLNGLPGAALALMLGWGPIATLAMFGVTAVSSSGIASKVLTDLGRLVNRETPSILSVLVIEDLAMAVYLPVLTALVAASTLGSIASSVLIALGIVGEPGWPIERRAPIEVRQREKCPDPRVLERHDVLDRAVGRVTRHLLRPQLTAEAHAPQQVA